MKQDEFERIKEYALSNFDLLEAEPTKVVGYDDLEGMFNIDEVFDRKGRAILLYQTENENMGHWVALLKDGDTIEIYDLYGYNPKEWDKQLGGNMGTKTEECIKRVMVTKTEEREVLDENGKTV